MNWTTKESVWAQLGISGENMFLTYDEGKLYTGTNSGNIYCLNGETGKPIWNMGITGTPQNAVCFDKDNMYVTADRLYSFSKHGGDINWSYPDEKMGFARGAPAADAKYVYIATQGGIIYKVEKRMGLPVKKYKINRQIRNPIALDKSLIFVSTTNREIMAVDISASK
jgi:outer membrane protein assembly factor BamB